MQGWISIHRKIQENELWQDKPFSRGQAWVDILLMVNYQSEKTFFDGNFIEVNRGSKITSIRKLCKRWGWSNTKVVKFLQILKEQKMIEYKSDNKKTVLTVANYDLYQNEDVQKRHRNDSETIQKHTNNKDNKGNKDKDISLQITNLRKRYSGEYLKVIDNYFDILKWTRKNGKIADSVIVKIYEQWEKYAIPNVIHGLSVYIGNPNYHDKKENYCYAIMRNATSEEINKKSAKKPKGDKHGKTDRESIYDYDKLFD